MAQKYQKFIVSLNALTFGASVLAHPFEHVDPMPTKMFPPDQSRVDVTAVSTSTNWTGTSTL